MRDFVHPGKITFEFENFKATLLCSGDVILVGKYEHSLSGYNSMNKLINELEAIAFEISKHVPATSPWHTEKNEYINELISEGKGGSG